MMHKTAAHNQPALERPSRSSEGRDGSSEQQFLRDEIEALLGAAALSGRSRSTNANQDPRFRLPSAAAPSVAAEITRTEGK